MFVIYYKNYKNPYFTKRNISKALKKCFKFKFSSDNIFINTVDECYYIGNK